MPINENDILSLLENELDEKVFVSKIFESGNLCDLLTVVSEKLSELDASIYQHVSEHNSELLNQTIDLENFTNLLDSVESRIRGVFNDVDRIKQKLAKPFEELNSLVTQIRRLTLLCDVFRKVQRISINIHKIKQFSDDLSKASEAVNDLEYMFASLDWKGISVLDEYHLIKVTERERLEDNAWKLIRSSFGVCDQAHLGLGLQVFDNLLTLHEAIRTSVLELQNEFQIALRAAVDADELTKRARDKILSNRNSSTNPGRASLPSNTSAQNAAFRSFFWMGLDQLLNNSLDRGITSIHLLCTTLRKKQHSTVATGYDGSTAVSLLQFTAQSGAPCSMADFLAAYAIENWTNPDVKDTCSSIVLVLATAPGDCAATEFAPQSSGVHSQILESANAFRAAVSASSGFFGWATSCMSIQFKAMVARSAALKEAFENEYPRLLKLFLDAVRKTRLSAGDDSHTLINGTTPALSTLSLPDHLQDLLQPFETAYLTRGLSRLFERASSVFTGAGLLPEPESINRIVEVVASELTHAAVHIDVLCKVTRNIVKLVDLVTAKAEALVEVTATVSASQLQESPNAAQRSNMQLVNLLCRFGHLLRATVTKHTRGLPAVTKAAGGQSRPEAIIDAALVKKLNSLCRIIAEPLVASITENIEEILSSMHDEYASSGFAPAQEALPGSEYVRKLQVFLQNVRTNFLASFSSAPAAVNGSGALVSDLKLREAVRGVAPYSFGELAVMDQLRGCLSCAIDSFLVHASLVRPCDSETSRLRLATDCAEFELALDQLTSCTIPGCRLIDLATDAYSRLRSFRPLLLTPTNLILTAMPNACLPGSTVLHHVIGRAPDEIPSPYAASEWSLFRYTRWLLHSSDEAARLNFIRHAIGTYTREVETRGQRHYPDIFPVIRDLLEYFETNSH